MTIVYWTFDNASPRPKNLTAAQVVEALKYASEIWNKAFDGLVYFARGKGTYQIEFCFGEMEKDRPHAIGRCVDFGDGTWRVTFDINSKWNVGGFRRFFGIGNDLRPAGIHELGHVMDLPHADDPTFIMYSQLVNKLKLDPKEIEAYRKFFIDRDSE